MEWAGRLEKMVSTTTAEPCAIAEALQALQASLSQPAVILTDSRGAHCCLRKQARTGELMKTALPALDALADAGFAVHFQWVASHVGVSGNERADRLVARAHDDLLTLTCPSYDH